MITQDIKINKGMIKTIVKKRTSIVALSLVIIMLTPGTIMVRTFCH